MSKIWILYILLFSYPAYSSSQTNVKCPTIFINLLVPHNFIYKQKLPVRSEDKPRMKELNDIISTNEITQINREVEPLLQEIMNIKPSHNTVPRIKELADKLNQTYKNNKISN